VTTSAITSLAILKVNWERLGRDYLDNFLPFAIAAICQSAEDVVALPALQSQVQQSFGLRLPLNALKTLLSRLAQSGHVRRESGVYYADRSKCADETFATAREEAEARLRRLRDSLTTFAATQGETLAGDQTEAALLAFVAEEGLDALYAKAEGRVVLVPVQAADTMYLVASFASQLQASGSPLFEDLLNLVRGHLLANALYLPDQGRVQQRFSGTTVYFDTSFLIYACGWAGKDREAPCAELLALLKEFGASLACFPETVEEVRGILDACAAILRSKDFRRSYGPTIEHFLAAGSYSTDVDLIAARVETHIAALGVRHEERPSAERAFQIDETGLERTLKEELHYRNQRALVHDVDCISGVMRRRRGRESNSIENCRAIFVTTNTELARVAKAFFQPEVPAGTVAPCITSHALGNVLWLKNPTAAPNLPRLQVIADAYAAMQPSDALWKVYLTEIARLEAAGRISADEYYLLRHSHSAKRALMDLTNGGLDAFSEGTALEILAVARDNLRADLDQELNEVRAELQTRSTELIDAKAAETRRSNQVDKLAGRFASVTSTVALLVTFGLLAFGTAYTFPWSLPQFQSAWWKYTLATAQICLLLYTLASMLWGTTVIGLIQRLRQWLAPRLSRRIRALLD
jgi:hypothetical protein